MSAAGALFAQAAARQDWTAAAAALSQLCALAKKQAQREALQKELRRDALHAALACPEPKARKNAARLLSAVGDAGDAPALAAALGREGTRYVMPSLLLALGAVGGDAAAAAQRAYLPPEPAGPEEQKHCEQIAAAHRLALDRCCAETPAPLHSLRAPREALLRPPAGLAEALLDELAALRIPAAAAEGGVRVRASSLDALYRARCFFEILLPCGRAPLAPEAVARAARSGWESLCGGAPDAPDAPALPYRVELQRYEGDRAGFIRALARAVGGRNQPGHYAFELRVVCRGAQADVFVVPAAVPDARFAYRTAAVPAAIHPVTAAALMRLAAMRLAGRARLRVYDPCCGGGTLLVEAARAMDCAALLGTDVSPAAVAIARQSLRAAGLRGAVLRRDCLRFDPGAPLDLVAANLPFGNRVGSHAANAPLYRGLAARLGALLRPGGLALLYTAEGRLLANILRGAPGLAVEAVYATEAGGLAPRAFFIRRA